MFKLGERFAFRPSMRSVIPIGGAFIVFMTFIVNEMVVDKYKELSEAISNSRNYFSLMTIMRSDGLVLADLQATIADELYLTRMLAYESRHPENVPRRKLEEDPTRRQNRASLTLMSESLANTHELLKVLTENQIENKKYAQLAIVMEDRVKLFDDTYELSDQEFAIGTGQVSPSTISTLALRVHNEKDRLLKDSNGLEKNEEDSIEELGKEVFARAEAEHAQDDDDYKRWKRFSYALYGLGWGLGLLGRFMKLDVDVPES